jgi:hypothetical protein
MTLVFRQLHDQKSSTYTYLLGDSESCEAILIDPVFEQARRDAALTEWPRNYAANFPEPRNVRERRDAERSFEVGLTYRATRQRRRGASTRRCVACSATSCRLCT